MIILKIEGKEIELNIKKESENTQNEEELCFQFKVKRSFINDFLFSLLFSNNQNTDEKIMLTKREKQVLEYISSGINNAQISQKLNVSIHTTKVHIHNIFNKLSAQDRTEAVVKAIKYGLIAFPKDFPNNKSIED